MTIKEFRSSAQREVVFENPVPLDFSIDGLALTAEPPSSGQLALFLASQNRDDPAASSAAILDLLEAILTDDGFAKVKAGMKAGEIDVEILSEVVEYLAEQWTTVPPTSAAVSSPRPRTSGAKSTGIKR